jgi:hypothetical protein
MNHLEILKANTGSLVRLALGILGGFGVAVSAEQTDLVMQGITQIASGVSLLVPVIWAIVKNWKAGKAKAM